MKKLSLSLSVIVSFILFSLFGKKTAPAQIPDPQAGNPPPTPTTDAATGTPVLSSPTAAPASSGWKNGTYTGSVADAFYGNIQVQAVVSGGRLTDVQFLQYPNDRSRSIMINQQAMPYLRSEAIQAQSAQVDIISGATDSSLAFIQSLDSALNQAR